MGDEALFGREDLVKSIIEYIKTQRVAVGEIGGVRIVVGFGRKVEKGFYGWAVWCEGTYAGRGQKGEEIFGSKERAEKYFEGLVRRYGLKEVKP